MKSGEQLRRAERDGVVDLNISLTSKVEFYCHRKLFIEWQDVDCSYVKTLLSDNLLAD